MNIVPQPPLSTAQHIPLIIPLNNLLVGDSDGPGNVELQASNPTQPNNASLLPIGGGNTFLFTPLGDFTGSTSFDFTVAPAVAQTKLPTGGLDGDYAGGSVAISSDGNEAVVGAPFMTINGQTQEGAA
ncbi:MAG TPA: cadherin-like domain-containing protein, partial [Pirellulales bacterium]|nr:cadherin-like domain-containing protein [Pirellulales bacterium]